MIVFDVELNGERYCRAGIDGHGVVSLMLHWMDFDGRAVTDQRDHLLSALSLNVTGHRAARAFTAADVAEGRDPPPMTAIHWRDVKQGLRVGDELRIRIVESSEADEPTETPILPPRDEDTGERATADSEPGPLRRSDETREYLSGEGCHILEVSGAADDPALSIARARVEPGVTTELHALDGIYERYLVTSGRGEVEIGGEGREPVEPGDVVLVPPGVSQRITNTGAEDLVFYCLCTPPWREDAYLALES